MGFLKVKSDLEIPFSGISNTSKSNRIINFRQSKQATFLRNCSIWLLCTGKTKKQMGAALFNVYYIVARVKYLWGLGVRSWRFSLWFACFWVSVMLLAHRNLLLDLLCNLSCLFCIVFEWYFLFIWKDNCIRFDFFWFTFSLVEKEWIL